MKSKTKLKILAVGLAVVLTACGGAEERKAKYMEKGKEYFAEKNYEKAKVEFKNVIQIDPKYPEAYFFMGQIEERKGDFQKAAGNYQQAIQLNPEYNDAKAKLARIFTMVGTDEYVGQAKTLLKEVFATQPENINAILVDATIDAKIGNKDLAITKLKKVIEKDPSFIEAYTMLSIIYVFNNNDDEAILLLKNGISKNDTNVSLRATLSQLLSKNKRDIAGAEEQAKKIIELEPDTFNYRLALATFYSATAQLDKAEAVLRQAIQDKDDDAQRYLTLVEFLARTKNVKVAETELQEAIHKNPKMYDLQFAQVEFYQNLKLTDKAVTVLNAISDKEDLSPQGLSAKTKLADIYVSRSETKKAAQLLDIILKEKPNATDALLVKAKLAFLSMDYQTVINALRNVLKDEPKNNEAALLLAQAHERNNEPGLAKETLERALEADPLNSKNHLNLAAYLASKNDMEKAEKTLDRALAYFKVDYELLQAKLKFAVARHDEKLIIKLLDLMKQNFPNNEEVRMLRGQYFLAKKQYSEALEEFEVALQHSTTIINPLEAIVKTYMISGKEQKAIEKLQARLVVNSDDVLANNFLGQIYASHKDNVKALEYYNKAMKQTTWDAPYIGASSSYIAKNDFKSALAVLMAGESKVSNPGIIQLRMASIYEHEKDFDKAIAMYEKLLDSNPANQLAANNLASLLLDFRSDEKSAKRALELSSDFAKTKYPPAMDTLGWALLKNNDAVKAIAVLEEAVRLSPEVAVYQYHLGVAYHQTGDVANAKRYLSKAAASKENYPGKANAKEILAKL